MAQEAIHPQYPQREVQLLMITSISVPLVGSFHWIKQSPVGRGTKWIQTIDHLHSGAFIFTSEIIIMHMVLIKKMKMEFLFLDHW